jgi:hypothetical protein
MINVSQMISKRRYIKFFNGIRNDEPIIDRFRKQTVSFEGVMARKPRILGSSFKKLSINALTVVCSYFTLRGRDFSKMRLINKKIKTAYERHLLGFVNIERLASEMGPAREQAAKESLDTLLKIANVTLPLFLEYNRKNLAKLSDEKFIKDQLIKNEQHNPIKVRETMQLKLKVIGKEMQWRARNHSGED